MSKGNYRQSSAELIILSLIRVIGRRETLDFINKGKNSKSYFYYMKAFKKFHPYEKI